MTKYIDDTILYPSGHEIAEGRQAALLKEHPNRNVTMHCDTGIMPAFGAPVHAVHYAMHAPGCRWCQQEQCEAPWCASGEPLAYQVALTKPWRHAGLDDKCLTREVVDKVYACHSCLPVAIAVLMPRNIRATVYTLIVRELEQQPWIKGNIEQ